MDVRAGGCVEQGSGPGGQRRRFVALEGRNEVLMFPDASDHHWGGFLTHVPTAELEGGIKVEEMSHEPLECLSDTFRGSQQRWVMSG